MYHPSRLRRIFLSNTRRAETIDMASLMLPELHDSTLLGLTLRWPEGRGRTVLSDRHGGPGAAVPSRTRGFTSSAVPRQFPWGPSSSVNSVRELPSQSIPALRELIVEMQSGDEIVVVAESFQLE
jgi:hypothetical protein